MKMKFSTILFFFASLQSLQVWGFAPHNFGRRFGRNSAAKHVKDPSSLHLPVSSETHDQILQRDIDIDSITASFAATETFDIDEMVHMLNDLERINNECTEECNQTKDECDIEVKAQRELVMEQLEYQIAKSRTDLHAVKACLSAPEPCSVDEMVRMFNDLERINNECTEECNQTNDECDIEVKAEREAVMEQLEYQIAKSRTDVDEVKACLASPEPCSVDEMVRMFNDLERINNECTEECNQTNDECDIEVKAEREAVMEQLEYQIAKSRTDVDEVKAYLAATELSDVDEMVRMLNDLERINNECTEECNQTNRECDVEVKAEREAVMGQLEYQIAKSRTDVDEVKAYLVAMEPCSINELTRMLTDLQHISLRVDESDVHLDIERKLVISLLEMKLQNMSLARTLKDGTEESFEI